MAPISPRPRPFAERPSGPLAAKPANDNVLGSWESGVFRFNSPEARDTWKRRSYEQGVGEDSWHLGKEIDPQSAGLMTAGFGGANPGLYQGPDGKYRLMNAKTIESQEARDHRNKYLTGKTMDQLASANAMPGADEWVGKGKAADTAANDNADAKNVRPASVAPISSQSAPATKLSTDSGAGNTFGGRFAPMRGAQKDADVQDAKDILRIATNSLLGNYGDEIRAGFGATGALFEGKSFGEAYDSNLVHERSESTAAEERQGLVGTGTELVTSFIPVIGDLSGAAADFKDWEEHGDEWGWEDYGLIALGLVPGVPGRKQLRNSKKLVDGLAEKAKSALKGEDHNLLESAEDLRKVEVNEASVDSAVKNADQTTFDPRSFFPKDENDILTKNEALSLPGEKAGLVWVTEPESHMPHAARYEKEGNGYVWSKKHNMPAKPSLRWENPDGDDLVKFDHLDPTPDVTFLVLVDSKADVPPSFPAAQKTAAADLRRQIKAVRQNNKLTGGPKFRIRYELPDEQRAAAMSALIKSLGVADEVTVIVREASQEAQNEFKKLRKKE